jgi:phosphoribosyl 1,2-cyclic phosphodiesterase
VKITLWGTRGSLPSPGPENLRYGGNTSCVEVRGAKGTLLVLDAGSGIRRFGTAVEPELKRVDILLTHLHLDHTQGLGFFAPLYRPELEVHIWGPPSATLDLNTRLARFFSTQLFPVRLGDLPSRPRLHDVPLDGFEVGEFRISADFVCHPGPTVGYRISENGSTITYLPDHEPALGSPGFPTEREWTSGLSLAEGADLLIHDAQYTDAEYPDRVGWGHSAIGHTLAFGTVAGVRRLVTFHHDPAHSDAELDRVVQEARDSAKLPFSLIPGTEGTTVELNGAASAGA